MCVVPGIKYDPVGIGTIYYKYIYIQVENIDSNIFEGKNTMKRNLFM